MNVNTNSLIKSFRRFTRFFSTTLKSIMMIVVIVPVTILSQSAPTVNSTSPINSAIAVALNQKITATFNMPMDASTITVATFSLKIGIASVSGFVSYSGTTAIFTPASNLAANAVYTAVITTGAKNMAGNALANNYVWSFTTGTAMIVSQIPVDLGTSGDFVILSKTGISTTGTTSITGDIGISPTAATYITGFGLIMDASGTFSTSTKVAGKVFASDYANPTPAKMTAAISDMETAYTNAAGRVTPNFSELFTGDLTGQTLTPGLYKWSTGVQVSAGGLIISGSATDVWIFQIAQNFELGNNAMVTLAGGAKVENIFWQVAGQVTLGTAASMKGIILCQTQIVVSNGATLTGRALAQTAVTLDANTVTKPSVTSVENGLITPQEFALFQNYPNPFNPSTRIQYTLLKAVEVTLKVYNVLGLEVATLVNSRQEAGSYNVLFNTNTRLLNLSSGVYFYRLETGSFVSTRKMILMK